MTLSILVSQLANANNTSEKLVDPFKEFTCELLR